jgi:hypothetical protein
MVQDSKKSLDQILEGFKRESARLLRVRDKRYNVAVIGCGEVGEKIIELLKVNNRVDKLVVSNKSEDKASWEAIDGVTKALPYDAMSSWLKDENIDVVIMTAGTWKLDRYEGLPLNAPPIENFAEAAKEAEYSGLTIIVNNPVAGLCQQFAVKTGFDPYSIIGFNPDPDRGVRKLVEYLRGDHVKSLLKREEEDEAEFYKRVEDRDIEGFRLCGAHAPVVKKPDGQEVACRIPIWKEARIRSKGLVSELFDFEQFRNDVPEWITKSWHEEHKFYLELEEKLKNHPELAKALEELKLQVKKGGHYHALSMIGHFLPFIDGEVEGMAPIVFDAERGIWDARPANCIYHRVQPMSDEDAGIVDEVKKQFDDVCKYYIGSCIDWLKENGFITEDEEEGYLKFARSVRPPEDKERIFGQRALRFVLEKAKVLNEILESSGLSGEEKADYKANFEKAKKVFFKKAGLFDLGYLYVAGSIEESKVYRVSLSSLAFEENVLLDVGEDITAVHGNESGLCLITGKNYESKTRVHSCNLRFLDFEGNELKAGGSVPLSVDLKTLAVSGNFVYLGYFEKNKGKVARLRRGSSEIRNPIPLDSVVKSIYVHEEDGRKKIFASCSGKVVKIDDYIWEKEKEFTAKTMGGLGDISIKDNLIFASDNEHVYVWNSDNPQNPEKFEADEGNYCVTHIPNGSLLLVTLKDQKLELRIRNEKGIFEESGFSLPIKEGCNVSGMICTGEDIAVLSYDTNEGKNKVHFYRLDKAIEDTNQEFILGNSEVSSYLFKGVATDGI